MRSKIKSFPEARYSSAFFVKIFIKDFVRQIICESLKYFLRSNILKKISSKDFQPSDYPKKYRFPKLLSVICNAKNSFLETVNCQTVTPITQKIVFRNCQLSNCNTWYELALSKKQEQSSRNLFFLSKNCNTVSCKNCKS